MISFSPSTTSSNSSGEASVIFLPMRSTARVRIWLILTLDLLGRAGDASSRVRGNPARCSWLVMAKAMTVPVRALKTS